MHRLFWTQGVKGAIGTLYNLIAPSQIFEPMYKDFLIHELLSQRYGESMQNNKEHFKRQIGSLYRSMNSPAQK